MALVSKLFLLKPATVFRHTGAYAMAGRQAHNLRSRRQGHEGDRQHGHGEMQHSRQTNGKGAHSTGVSDGLRGKTRPARELDPLTLVSVRSKFSLLLHCHF